MLQVNEVSHQFQNKLFSKESTMAVDRVSFQLEQGKTLGIAGNSGCGKSTLARLITGLLPTHTGDIHWNGQNLAILHQRKQHELRRKVQIIFQHPESALDPSKRVGDSLVEPLHIHPLYTTPSEKQKKLEEVMELCHIRPALLRRYPHQISGGEAQRICVGRVLMMDPELLILDEPTSMLDVSVQAYIMTLFKELQQQLDLTYLVISHDLTLLRWCSDEILVMSQGRVVEHGSATEIYLSPKMPVTQELVSQFRLFEDA